MVGRGAGVCKAVVNGAASPAEVAAPLSSSPGGRARPEWPGDEGAPRRGSRMVRYSFPNKVVLVTGSSRGMGAAILEAFARAGATCIVNYFEDPSGQNRREAEDTAARLRQLQVPVHVLEADVSRYESVETLMKRVA